jgi:hypothetical protein
VFGCYDIHLMPSENKLEVKGVWKRREITYAESVLEILTMVSRFASQRI